MFFLGVWLKSSPHYLITGDKPFLIARFMGQHGAHLGPTGPRWAPCWPREHYLNQWWLTSATHVLHVHVGRGTRLRENCIHGGFQQIPPHPWHQGMGSRCAHLCYKMVHCGIFMKCILRFVRWVYWKWFSYTVMNIQRGLRDDYA